VILLSLASSDSLGGFGYYKSGWILCQLGMLVKLSINHQSKLRSLIWDEISSNDLFSFPPPWHLQFNWHNMSLGTRLPMTDGRLV